jgi:hypothetical protein
MLEQILYNEMTYWLLGTAVVFTFVGRYTAYRDALQDVVAATIDSLIEDGYIKTKGEGEDMEILKHWEHNNES